MVTAGPWYATAGFSAVLAVVGVLIGGVGVWAALVFGRVRRRLWLSMPAVTPLLTHAAGQVDAELQVRYGDTVVAAPHVVELRLMVWGRRDVRAEDFSGGQPLTIEVGVPVVRILQVAWDRPGTAATPDLRVAGSVVAVLPSLLTVGRRLSLSLLVDGAPPEALTCPAPPLADVHVRWYDGTSPLDLARSPWTMLALGLFMLAGGVFGLSPLNSREQAIRDGWISPNASDWYTAPTSWLAIAVGLSYLWAFLHTLRRAPLR